ncbi:MAG: ABC transporter substrate-binding protein [Anaerolineae bacterium]
MKKLLSVALILGLALALVPGADAQEGVYFRTAGGWDAPPAWHGNHYVSGCCGAAWWFIWEPLFHYVPGDDSIVMRLAQSYELSDDGLLSTVVLQEGSTWHDGTPATAQDVWDSFAFEKSWNALVWQFLDDIEIVDDMTLRFHWKQATPIARQLLAGIQIRAPHHIYGEWAQAFWDAGDDEEAKNAIWEDIQEFRPDNPIGTGPFMIETVTESTMLFSKFEAHPFADNVGFDGVRVERHSSNEAMWNMLQAGELDAFHPAAPPDVVEAITSQEGMEYVLVSDLAEFSIYFNPEKYDLATRAALVKAIDRPQMREVSLYYARDASNYATGVLASLEEMWLGADFMADLTAYPYDPEAATAELEALGYSKDGDVWKDPDGNDVNIVVGAPSTYSDWVLACENLAQQLTNFGMPAECQPRDVNVYWDDQDALSYDIDIGWFGVAWGTGHPYTSFDRLYTGSQDDGRKLGLKGVEEFEVRGEVYNTTELLATLGSATAFEDQQAVVQQLALVTNENLVAMPYLEKQLGIFRSSAAMEGWPAADDPLWTMCGGGIERFYVTLMVTGQLQPR